MDQQIFTPLKGRDMHLAAMQWFEVEQMSNRELFTHEEPIGDSSWHGYHFRLTRQSQGIWKPREFKVALIFKIAAPDPRKETPHADWIGGSGLLRYKSSDTKKWADDTIKVTAQRNYPLAQLVGMKPAPSALLYYARPPVYIIDIDEHSTESIVAIDETTPATPHYKDSGQIEKKYISRRTRE